MAFGRNAEGRVIFSGDDRVSRTISGIEGRLERFNRLAGGTAIAAGAIFTARAIGGAIKFADETQRVLQRLDTATKRTGDFEAALSALVGTAGQTGVAFETTVGTFQNLARVADDIGATNTQMLSLADTVTKLGVIGGSSTEALKFGIRQFNQAMAAGIFRAEEFNSIVENIPELAKRIADGLGATQGELRKMVIEGRLFSRDVMETLLLQSKGVRGEFEELEPLISRSLGTLTTALGQAVSQTGGLTQGIAEAIDALSFFISPEVDPDRQLEQKIAELATAREGLVGAFNKVAARAFNDDAIPQLEAEIAALREKISLREEEEQAGLRRADQNARAAVLEKRQASFSKGKVTELGLISQANSRLARATQSVSEQEEASFQAFKNRAEQRIVLLNEQLAAEKKIAETEVARLNKAQENAEEKGIDTPEFRDGQTEKRLAAVQTFLSFKEQAAARELVLNQAIADAEAARDANTASRLEQEEAREIEANDRRVSRSQSLFERLEEQRLQAEGREIEFAELRLIQVQERLEAERLILEEHGLLTQELRDQFRLAEEDAEAASQARIAAIKEEAQQKSLQAQKKLDQQSLVARQGALNSVLGALQVFGNKNKALEVSLAAIQAGLAAVRLFKQGQADSASVVSSTQVAAARALAELGPIAGPPVAAGIQASGTAAVAAIQAATGAGIAAQALSFAGNSFGAGGGGDTGGQFGGGGGRIDALPDPVQDQFAFVPESQQTINLTIAVDGDGDGLARFLRPHIKDQQEIEDADFGVAAIVDRLPQIAAGTT